MLSLRWDGEGMYITIVHHGACIGVSFMGL